MSIRTDTEPEGRTESRGGNWEHKCYRKGIISDGKTSLHWPPLYIPLHPAIAVHCSQQPFYFVCFFHNWTPAAAEASLYHVNYNELEDVLVIIS